MFSGARMRGGGASLRIEAYHGRDEAITIAINVLYIAHAAAAIAQGLAECRDVHSESALFNDRVRPDTRDQLALSDGFARSLHQGEENLPRTATQSKGHAGAKNQSLPWIEPERSEREVRSVPKMGVIYGLNSSRSLARFDSVVPQT
jgi:hypothetical protein